MERVGVGRGRWLEQMSEKGESSRIDGSAHICPLLTPNTRPAIWSRVQVGDASGVRACGGGGRRRGRSGVGWWWRERALAGEGGACVGEGEACVPPKNGAIAGSPGRTLAGKRGEARRAAVSVSGRRGQRGPGRIN